MRTPVPSPSDQALRGPLQPRGMGQQWHGTPHTPSFQQTGSLTYPAESGWSSSTALNYPAPEGCWVMALGFLAWHRRHFPDSDFITPPTERQRLLQVPVPHRRPSARAGWATPPQASSVKSQTPAPTQAGTWLGGGVGCRQ